VATKKRAKATPKKKAKATPKKKAKATPKKKAKAAGPLDVLRSELRDLGMSYPGAWEDFPWGDPCLKVGKKIFAFIGEPKDGSMGFTTKLPHSSLFALELPFTRPTGYGLGKSGWVSATLSEDECPPPKLLRSWLEESYRAVAGKRQVAELDARAGD
jgi:predicted DNA-binding protein (MmcQ/YjbR family)